MADVIFCDTISGEPLPFEEDGGYHVRTQYDGPWIARLVGPLEGRLGLWDGGTFRDLVWDDRLLGYTLPKKTSAEQRFAKTLEDTPGLLSLICWSGRKMDLGRQLEPSLFTSPASLSQAEYGALLTQLREVAIAAASAVRAPVLIGRQPSGYRMPAEESLSGQARALIALSDVAQAYWPLIGTYPTRELRRQPVLVRAEHPRAQATSAGVVQQAIRPDRTRTSVEMVVEDTDTAENRFLCYILEQILGKQAAVLTGRLRRQAHLLERQGGTLQLDGLPRRYKVRYQERYREQQQQMRSQIARYEDQARKLEQAAQWARFAVQSPWLQQSVKQACVPKQPSQRLLRGMGYAPIYQAYLRVTHVTSVDAASRMLDLVGHYEEHPVRSIDQLYELWLFFQVYQILIDDFGFQPRGLQPMEALKWEKGRLALPPTTGFQLVLQIEDQGGWIEICQVELRYDSTIPAPDCNSGKHCFNAQVCPELPCYRKIMSESWKNSLRPDVSLMIRYDGEEYRFALDAKYRDYDKPCVKESDLRFYSVDNAFDHDVLGIAKMKYFDALGLTAAFIVHTDSRPEYTFFGQEPFCPTPMRQAVAIEKSVPQRHGWQQFVREARLNVNRQGEVWPAHCFGAICATPLQPGNLHKLLKCLLMYHVRIVNVCWHCRQRLTVDNNGADTEPSTAGKVRELSLEEKRNQVAKIEKGDTLGAVYYSCPDCRDFWVLQRCYGQRHPLVKLGGDSFHAPSRIQPDKVWVSLCPACGSDLPEQSAGPVSKQGF